MPIVGKVKFISQRRVAGQKGILRELLGCIKR